MVYYKTTYILVSIIKLTCLNIIYALGHINKQRYMDSILSDLCV